MECRLLIYYHPTLMQYQAVLGVDASGDTKVLVSLERHPTHKGWHVHACCDRIDEAPAGIRRGPWVRNLEGRGRRHQTPIPASDEAAFARAASFFRLDRRDGERLL